MLIVAEAPLASLEAAGRDHLRCEARISLARTVNELSHDDMALAAVQAGAKAFIHEVVKSAESLGTPLHTGNCSAGGTAQSIVAHRAAPASRPQGHVALSGCRRALGSLPGGAD